MEEKEYIELIKETYEEVIANFKTLRDKTEFQGFFSDVVKKLIDTKDETPKTTFEAVISDYLNSVEAISKLSPGLATGLHDEEENITLNTYNGKMSDIPNDEKITEKSVFDASSMTKMFTSILLLKEAENGNIDLNKNFSDYSPLLSNVDVPIIDALRFGINLRTDGRLDEPDISKEERERRFKSTYVFEKDTFIYSDIPYMLVPLLFGKTMEEATENYINKFYELYRDELGLSKTGYSTINMTGGTVKSDLGGEENSYSKDGLYDPKADIFEREVGYVSGHAGVTTTVNDLEKLFDSLSHGLLSEESLKALTTTIQPESKVLLDKEGNPVIRRGKEVIINHAMGVYINTGSIRESDIPARYSEHAFAAEGSTGTYSVFDIENGLNMTYLSNVRSGNYSKSINTGDYTYGDDEDVMPKNFATTLLSGTHFFKNEYSTIDPSGALVRPDGTFMTYVRATNNFKEEGLETLLKLRIAKKVLIKKSELEYSGEELEEALRQIDKVFNSGRKQIEEKNKTM